jgi:phage-related minor tail protein
MASNKIKGLTVEIGGDTTKLGKALDNVEKQGKGLSGELKEINRLLKNRFTIHGSDNFCFHNLYLPF